MNKLLLVSTFCLPLLSSVGYSEAPRPDSELLKDPSLVRCYLFQEGIRGQVRQLAGNGDGTLFLANDTLYGEPFSGSRRSKWLGPDPKTVGVKWGQGRFPGTFSIRPGTFSDSVVHSRFYSTDTGSFSIVTWVRPREGTGALLWSGRSDFKDGGFGLADNANVLSWTVMTKDGPVKIETPSLKRGAWHQVVASWNAETKTSQLFVDGKLLGEGAGKAAFVPSPSPAPSGFESTEDDYDGLRVGGFQGIYGTLFFDVDELLVFSRVLSASEIAAAYAAGKPAGSEPEQLAAYAQETQDEEAAGAIDISIPKDSFGYFTLGSNIPLEISIPAKRAGKYSARWNLQDINSQIVSRGEKILSAISEEGTSVTVPLQLDRCGLYFLHVEVRDESDHVLRQVEYPIGIIVQLPPADQRPVTSPLGAHAAIDRWPEATGLGVSNFRPIGWWEQMEPKPGVYNFEYNDQMVDEARKRHMEVMFCLNGVPSFADDPEAGTTFAEGKRTMDQYREFVTQLVRHYKGRVTSWEIINETNATQAGLGSETGKAKRYVEILKTAYEVIKKEDPESKVVGICGCPGFVPWTEAVLAAGGGPYFDILSVHNYRVNPITESVREKNILNVRDVLKRYGKDCPVWSTEFGVHQPRRIDGRPMSREKLLDLYAKKLGGDKGEEYVMIDMPLVPEAQAADWTIQAWLLDLANGCDRFFMLMGPNRFTPPLNDAEGTPSEMGVAFAAMAKVIMTMEKAEVFPLDSLRDAGVSIFQKDGRRDVVLFSEDQPELVFRAPGTKVIHGMDWLGNPWKKKVGKDGIVRLQVGSHPLYVLDVPKEFAPVSLIHIAAEGAVTEGKMTGDIVLSNPEATAATFHLAVETVKGIEVEFSPVSKVPAHGMVKVPFVLQAGELSRGTHETVFTVTNDAGIVIARTQLAFESLDTVISVPRMKAPIPFTADPDAWKDIKGTEISAESFVLSGKPVQGVPWAPQWRGAADLSFTYRLAWDPSEGLAILVEVTDDQFRPAPEEKLDVMFRYDCLEVFLDTRPVNLRLEPYSTGADQILVRPADSEKPEACTTRQKAGDSLEARFISRRTQTGYIIEGRIKPKAGATWKLEAGLPFALDLLLDDADKDLRKTILGIGFGGNDNSVSTKRWGWFKLAP